MDNLINQFIKNWPVSVLLIVSIIILLFLIFLKINDYWKLYRLQYALECEKALNKQLQSEVNELSLKNTNGNRQYLEMKKEFLHRERALRLKYQANMIEVDQEIAKVKKQIDRMKSK